MQQPVVIQSRNKAFINVYDVLRVHVWLVSEETDIVWYEDAIDVGLEPPWLTEMVKDPWPFVLGIRTSELVDWGLSQGIAPGQPFRIELGCPEYSFWHGSVDTHAPEWHVDDVAYLSHGAAATRWEVLMMRQQGVKLELLTAY